MSIIRHTSTSYFQSKFSSAMFYSPEGTPCILPSMEHPGLNVPMFTAENKIRAFELGGTAEKPVRNERLFEYDYFDSMEKFNVPDLGWRAAADGRVMSYFERSARSYKKGVCLDNIGQTHAGHTLEMMDTGNISRDYYSRPTTTALLVLAPNYLPLNEGLAAMNDGKIMGFAVSPRLAVLPGPEDRYLLAYGTSVVGSINPDGHARMSIKQSLEELL